MKPLHALVTKNSISKCIKPDEIVDISNIKPGSVISIEEDEKKIFDYIFVPLEDLKIEDEDVRDGILGNGLAKDGIFLQWINFPSLDNHTYFPFSSFKKNFPYNRSKKVKIVQIHNIGIDPKNITSIKELGAIFKKYKLRTDD